MAVAITHMTDDATLAEVLSALAMPFFVSWSAVSDLWRFVSADDIAALDSLQPACRAISQIATKAKSACGGTQEESRC